MILGGPSILIIPICDLMTFGQIVFPLSLATTYPILPNLAGMSRAVPLPRQ